MTGVWWQDDFYVYDVESTGVRVRADRVVTATLLHVDVANRATSAQEWLADPGVEIPTGASDIHGITTEMAREKGRPAVEVIAEIADALRAVFESGKALVIYNAPFDLTMTGCEIFRYLGDPFEVPECVVDPLVLDKRLNQVVRGKGARKLVNTCRRNGIVLSEQDAHTSAGDTLAAGRLAWAQMSRSRMLSDLSLRDLHSKQKDWFRDQSIDFAGWLRTKDLAAAERCVAEAETWPMHPLSLEPFEEPAQVPESGGAPPF